MKNIFIRLNATIFRILGICNHKGCFKKATVNINIPVINAKRCMCEKHFNELMRIQFVKHDEFQFERRN